MLTQNLCNQARKRASGVGLILFIFLLTACGTQPAPPATPTSPPTETPTPQPTLTPTPTVIPGPFESQPAIPYPSDEIVQGLGITDYQVVGEQYVALNEEGYVVAQAITNENGEFTGWQRTVPFDVESGLVVPHPQETNPELVDLEKSDAPIPQFVNAMDMAGIEVEPQEVANNLQYQAITGADGKPYVIGAFNLDPDPNQQGETLEGPIPLMVWGEEGGWKNERYVPFRLFADKLGVKISTISESMYYENYYEKSRGRGDAYKNFNAGFMVWHSRWDLAQPKIDKINYSDMDKIVRFAEKYNIETLDGPIIHQQGTLPEWLTQGNFSNAELEKYIRYWTRNLMEHFQGKINYWIVVNEYHPTPYENQYLYSRLGWKFVEIAFEEARKTNPDAILIYNDNAIESPNWQWFSATYNTVKKLKEKGLVDAVGMQMHLNQPNWTSVPSEQELSQAIRRFRQLGLEVYITEMDVSLTHNHNSDRFLYQAEIYRQIIETYLRETQGQRAQIISFFDFRDPNSWIEKDLHYPDADPLLFNDQINPKPSFYAILQLLYRNALSNDQ